MARGRQSSGVVWALSPSRREHWVARWHGGRDGRRWTPGEDDVPPYLRRLRGEVQSAVEDLANGLENTCDPLLVDAQIRGAAPESDLAQAVQQRRTHEAAQSAFLNNLIRDYDGTVDRIWSHYQAVEATYLRPFQQHLLKRGLVYEVPAVVREDAIAGLIRLAKLRGFSIDPRPTDETGDDDGR